MATAVARGLAGAVLTGFVLVPTGLLLAVPAYAAESPAPEVGIADPLYEEGVPDPVTGLYPGQYVPATESSPATPGWITGDTLQPGSGAAPVAKPAAKPVRAAAKPAAAAPIRVGRVAPSAVAGPSAAAQVQPTALAFTGPGRLVVQLSVGAGLVLVGAFVTLAAGPHPVSLTQGNRTSGSYPAITRSSITRA